VATCPSFSKRINEVLETEESIKDGKFDGKTKEVGTVEFKNVSFKYPDASEYLLKDISFKVKRTKRPISLEPMNQFERRVIHSALQNDRFVSTHSEGEEPYRHVVVTLKRS